MAKTIEEGFSVFHGKLTPTKTETEASKKHRSSIEECLESNFSISRFFRSGSTGNGTGISGHSDVDYFASIPGEHITGNSNSTLIKVKEALRKRFPNTGVVVRTPGVLVPFGSSPNESTEVIPANFITSDSSSCMIYEIADGKGGWIRTSPDKHNQYVSVENDRLSGKVKPLVRFIKAWKYFKDVPISSFYIEMIATKYASGENSILYYIDIHSVLQEMWDNNLSSFQDPTGISGQIYACTSSAAKEESLSKLKTALTRAENAHDAVSKEKTREAFEWYDKLYDYNFPSYY